MQTALCLPPSLLCLLSSLVHLSLHPHHPLPPPLSSQPCLNLLKRRCGLTVVISYHATTVLCVTSAQYTLDRSSTGSLWIPTPWRRPGHPGTCQYCHVLYSSLPQPHTLGVCVLTKPCLSRGGFTGLQPPAIAIPSTLPSPKLEGQRQSPWRKQHKRGKVVMHREHSLLCYPMIFWLTEHSKSQRILIVNTFWKCW